MTSDSDSPASPASPSSPDSPASPESPASPGSPDSPASPGSPDSPASPASPSSPAEPADVSRSADLAEEAAAEPVDTEQLERSRQAIAEGHEAAAKALDPPPDSDDLEFADVKQNDDPDASGNAVPRPS